MMTRQNLQWIFICAVLSVVCYRTVQRNPFQRYFGEILDHIDSDYVEPKDQQQLFEAAVSRVMEDLDENSDYFPPGKSGEFQNELNSEFVGIGIEPRTDKERKTITIQNPPFHGTPAEKAGLRAGDEIIKVDGERVAALGFEESIKRIRGLPGTKVELEIRRAGSAEPLLIPLTRDVIVRPSVVGYGRNAAGEWSYRVAEAPQIVYLRIDQFAKHTTEELREILARLQPEGIDALILDMRGNPGGYLDDAVKICDLFLKSGTILTTKGRRENQNQTHTASGNAQFTNFPMAVLVNRASASASEIVAAALQDHHRAIIVGERSFGKGTVQHVFPLSPDAEGQTPLLKLTSGYYYRPSERNMHRFKNSKDEDDWGVRPDASFDRRLSDEEWKRLLLWQLKRENRAAPPPNEKTEQEILNDANVPEIKPPEIPPAANDKPIETEFGALLGEQTPDPQLRSAVEALQKKLHAAVLKAASRALRLQ